MKHWTCIVRQGLLLVLLLAGIAPPALHAQEPGVKYAFVVGINEYKSLKLPKLQFAANDAKEFAATLKNCGYRVTLESAESAAGDSQSHLTKQHLEMQLMKVLNQCHERDMIVIAVASNGVQIGDEMYLCPSDADPTAGHESTLISLSWIYDQLDKSAPHTKLLFIDAGRNSPASAPRRPGNARPNARGVAALFSCSAGQSACEPAALKHGLLFYSAIKGLQGEAADNNGRVTFASLSEYIGTEMQRQTRKLGAPSQQPALYVNQDGPSPVLFSK